VRDGKTGEPTGVLKDNAMDLVWRVVPSATAQEQLEAFHRAQAYAIARGVTMVVDMGNFQNLATYRGAHAKGDLKVRVYAFVPLYQWHRMSDYIAHEGTGDLRLRWGGVKGFVDGSLGSTTAWFYRPFDDAPNTSGLMVTDTADLRKWTLQADRAGLQVAVHAIGDRANDWMLRHFSVGCAARRRARPPFPHRARAASHQGSDCALRTAASLAINATVSRHR
jgi:predicted amidohydrolase YtcJ